MNELNKCIIGEEADIDRELFSKHFNFQKPSAILGTLRNLNDRTKNKNLVNVIENGLTDLKKEIGNMGEKEKEIKKPNEIVNIVEKIHKFNKQNQQGEGLKILTTNQMLSRLPISLAQLNTGNNS